MDGCADLLRVSDRTIRGWESGATRVPYAAYKLMRVLKGGRYLHHAHWAHFSVRGPVLATPEGHELQAGDIAWLTLLVRRASAFGEIMRDRRGHVLAERSGSAGRGRDATATTPPIVDNASACALAFSASAAPRLESGIGQPARADDIGSTHGTPPGQTPELQMTAIERSAGGLQETPEAALLSLTLPERLAKAQTPRNKSRAAAKAVQS